MSDQVNIDTNGHPEHNIDIEPGSEWQLALEAWLAAGGPREKFNGWWEARALKIRYDSFKAFVATAWDACARYRKHENHDEAFRKWWDKTHAAAALGPNL